MKQIYKVGGTLPKGFVGQIAYTVCLDKEYSSMDMVFSFDKRQYPEITEEARMEFIEACTPDYTDIINKSSAADIDDYVRQAKTEIHTIMYMNDTFIGGVHKQLTERHMIFSPGETSVGCIPQSSINGVVKVILVVFNVILDETPYTVTLNVE